MAIAPQPVLERRRFRVTGVVQGVGFRPFVHALAARLDLSGFVLNDGEGVLAEIEGRAEDVAAFAQALHTEAPPLARVDAIAAEPMVPTRGRGFTIRPSVAAPGPALVAADVATCEDCLRELHDPADRRFRYPFVNCTNCGPRFTIVRRVPYGRANTTMAEFALCADCRREYEDPGDRRFHAEPTACPACGPRLSMPLEEAARMLRDGAVVAVKGLGGWHLACLAADEGAVAKLRSRKHRERKPFAVMAKDARPLVEAGPTELGLLRSPQRPIVLLRRRAEAPVAESVAPGDAWLGVMLPYTPLHHLLLGDVGEALVMTSGNRSDEPIAVGDAEARARLEGIADAFLGHDREVHRRCEDSVVRVEHPVRRSRGYAPGALGLPVRAPVPVVAAGAELKSTFCVARGSDAFLSPHLGDLDSEAAYRAFRGDLELYLEMLACAPAAVAHDHHPDYLSTRWALEQDLDTVPVQHHHAHAAACLAEHGEEGPALALVFDGTGYGTDGTLWGGELLRFDLTRFERVAHLDPVPLPGGAAAIREPWRMAGAYLEAAGRPVPFERWSQVRQSLAVNAPLSSGMGRLFDAVAALLGACHEASYEGEAAVELERLAADIDAEPYPCRVEGSVIVGSDFVAAAHDDLAAGRDRGQIAAAVHEGVAMAAAAACETAGAPATVVLSGGSFQNLRLLHAVRSRLEHVGFRVMTHRHVPPNDGGVSYGQAAVAAATLSERSA